MPTDDEVRELFREFVREDNVRHGRDPDWTPSEEEKKAWDEEWPGMIRLGGAAEIARQYERIFGAREAHIELDLTSLRRMKAILEKPEKTETDFVELERLIWLQDFEQRSSQERSDVAIGESARRGRSKGGKAQKRAQGIEEAIRVVLKNFQAANIKNPPTKKIWDYLISHLSDEPYEVVTATDRYEIYQNTSKLLAETRDRDGRHKQIKYSTFQDYVTRVKRENLSK